MKLSDRVKSEVSLRALAERSGVQWDPLKSAPARGDFWAPCPFHKEATASFHVVEKGGRNGWFKCFGCEVKGSVVDFVILMTGCDARSALKQLADDSGLEANEDPAKAKRRAEDYARRQKQAEADAARKSARGAQKAWDMWRAAEPAGEFLEAYLTARGVNLSAIGGVPKSLRFAPALDHFNAKTGQVTHTGPAMVGLVGRNGSFVGVHRTWISETGRALDQNGSKIPKHWLGKTGEMFGVPVRLSSPSRAVVVGEGIETTLAAWSALRAFGLLDWSAEAALSLGSICGPEDAAGRGPELGVNGKPLPSIIPAPETASPGWVPAEGVEAVLILGEGSSKCPESARRHYDRAFQKINKLNVSVRVRVPENRWDLDLDFADIAKAGKLWD